MKQLYFQIPDLKSGEFEIAENFRFEIAEKHSVMQVESWKFKSGIIKVCLCQIYQYEDTTKWLEWIAILYRTYFHTL